MALVVGKKIITNVQHFNRVADLEGSAVNAPIIGFKRHGQANQIFNFEPTENTQVKISIRVGNQDVYVASVDPSAGAPLRGVDGGVFSLYTVHQRPGEVFKISIESGGRDLFWTLENDAEKTRVTLQPENGGANQLWAPEAV
ncbi:hypothetical protein EST38_g10382 [Candolleomyces aberdarensis]|uniref:Ricin B lectin domain-containing protein n=1 Tax=Candolleomyces aberdarensis TaxID=2316362 RepID=A0A4Q2DAF0_9AGAR|nr:hypothetical protein EST38_g10382 [Candolleomyces aberdarensis]